MDEQLRFSVSPLSDEDNFSVDYQNDYELREKNKALDWLLDNGQGGVTVTPEIVVTPDETPDIAPVDQGGGASLEVDPANETATDISGVPETTDNRSVGDMLTGAASTALQVGSAVVGDVVRGGTEAVPQAFGGFVDAIGEVDQFLQSLIPGLGGMRLFDKDGNFDPTLISNKEMQEIERAGQTLFDQIAPADADSVTGGIIRSASQFLTGFLPAVSGLGALGVGGLAASFAGGAIADAVVFDPHEKRLSTFLNEVPALEALVPDYLADTGPQNQSEWEGRLKNAVEGAGLGALSEGLLKAFKYYKAQRQLGIVDEAPGAEAAALRDQQQDVNQAELSNSVSDEMLLPLGDASPNAPLVVTAAPDQTLQTSLTRLRDADARVAEMAERGDALDKIQAIAARRPSSGGVPTGDTARDSMDDVLDALRSNKAAPKMTARPVSGIVKSLGGIDPTSSLAGDLRSRGINARSFPGLFKRGGLNDLDNIPASEHPLFMDNATINADGYIDRQSFVDGLEAELRGDPWRTADERTLIDEQIAPAQDLEEQLSRLGIDYENMSNDAVKARIREIEEERSAYEAYQSSVISRIDADGQGRSYADLDTEQREIWSAEQIADARAAGVSDDVIKAHEPPKVFINMARINTSDDVRRLIQTVADADEAAIRERTRGEVSNAQTIRESSQEYKDLNDLIGRAPGPMSAAQAVAARRVLASSAEQVAQLAKLAANPNAGKVDQYNFRRAISVHAAIQAEVIGARTETARALQSWAIPVGSSKARTDAITELTSLGTGGDLQKLAQSIVNVSDEAQINQLTREMVKMRTRDALYSVYVNGLLSGYKTHLVNIMSNSATALYAIPERYAAEVGSNLFGKGDIPRGEATAMAYGMMQGVRDGFRLMVAGPKAAGLDDLSGLWDTFGKTEMRPNPISAEAFGVDPSSTMARGIDVMGRAISVPGTLLERGDLFFKTLNYRMELNALAYREASMQGLEGRSFADKVSDILLNPPAHLQEEANRMALVNTFTNPLGELGRKYQTAISNSPMRWVVPFVRTPTNIMKYSFARTPLAYKMASVQADIAAGGARAAQAHARVAMGTMMMMTVAGMAIDGHITGGGPLDPGMSAAWRAAGNQPYSVKIGDRWYSYSRMDPIGMMIGLAADISTITNAPKGDADDSELVMAGVIALSQNLASKTYLQGIVEFMGAIDPRNPMSDPGKFLEGYAGSITPYSAFLRQTAQGMDPIMRETRAPSVREDGETDAIAGYLNSLVNNFKRGIPGLSDTLPPVRDVFGQPMTYESGIGAAYDMIVPIQSKSAEADPVAKEILDNEVKIQRIGRTLNGVTLTADQYDQLQQIAGPMLKEELANLMGRSVYQRFPAGKDSARAEMIKSVQNSVYKAARDRMVRTDPELKERIMNKRVKTQNLLLGNQ